MISLSDLCWLFLGHLWALLVLITDLLPELLPELLPHLQRPLAPKTCRPHRLKHRSPLTTVEGPRSLASYDAPGILRDASHTTPPSPTAAGDTQSEPLEACRSRLGKCGPIPHIMSATNSTASIMSGAASFKLHSHYLTVTSGTER